ncbi:MAG: RidA family protein [Lachnospirales bacterium]
MKKIITSKNAPLPIGPYSIANLVKGTLYMSGQLGIDPNTSKLVEDEVVAQTTQIFENAKNILKEANMTFDNVVKVTVLLDDMGDFAKMNEVYGKYFTENFPARMAYEVAKLPLNAKVEIDMIAVED